jgi:hypothetical protein
MVVWYYDVAMAKNADLAEEEMRERRKGGLIEGPVEMSSIAEARKWVRESRRS